MREYIVLDYCGVGEDRFRYTHIPSYETIVRGEKWDEKRILFLSKYPGLTIHRCSSGPYRESGDILGTTCQLVGEIKARISAERFKSVCLEVFIYIGENVEAYDSESLCADELKRKYGASVIERRVYRAGVEIGRIEAQYWSSGRGYYLETAHDWRFYMDVQSLCGYVATNLGSVRDLRIRVVDVERS